MPHEQLDYILLTEEQIQTRVAQLGEEINRDYAGKEPLVVGLLCGSFIFMADLVRSFDFQCEMAFMRLSSYGNRSETSGCVNVAYDPLEHIEGRDVLIVEDIVDSGVTLSCLIELLKTRAPASLRLCTLLDKPSRRRAPVHVDYCGFEIPDAFVVGYGLDYAERWRQLPYIGVLKLLPDA